MAQPFVHMIAQQQTDGSFRMQEVVDQSQSISWDHSHLAEGQLSVDVYTTEQSIVIIAPMAGSDTQAISVTLHDDVLTIRGVRGIPFATETFQQSIHQECFWGRFSRTIVLPHPVLSHKVHAEYTNGVLSIELTKAQIDSKIPIHIIDE